MDHISRVLQLTDYIEANLPNVLSVSHLSEWLGVSKWHLQREFKEVTGHSIGQYSTGRRLSLAAQALAKDNYRILDVALDYGFESQEAFARAFKRHFKISPKNLKGQLSWADNIKFQPLTRAYLECYQQLKGFKPKLVKLDEMQLVALPKSYVTIRHGEAEFNQALHEHWQQFTQSMMRDLPDLQLMHDSCFSVEFSNHCSYETGEFLMMSAAAIGAERPKLPEGSELIYFNLAPKSYYCFELPSHDWVASFLRYAYDHYLPEQQLALVDYPVLWQGTEQGGVKCYLPLSADKTQTTPPKALKVSQELVTFTPSNMALEHSKAPLSCHQLSHRLAFFLAQFPQLIEHKQGEPSNALIIGALQAKRFNIEHEFHGAMATPIATSTALAKGEISRDSLPLTEAKYLNCKLEGSLAEIGEAMKYVYHYYLWDSPYYRVQGLEWLTDIKRTPDGAYSCNWRIPVKHRSGKQVMQADLTKVSVAS
ncbi:helix-turn-helix domain-containing protein [Motilimonas sp. KMU-193]|uniref:helix-turn-helix domain-containing protein n=1 Tax=Motilimonas sp. KMU-193 TaxID=3388668 RepID=UPI00396B16AD